jgi:hypothetical protein
MVAVNEVVSFNSAPGSFVGSIVAKPANGLIEAKGIEYCINQCSGNLKHQF